MLMSHSFCMFTRGYRWFSIVPPLKNVWKSMKSSRRSGFPIVFWWPEGMLVSKLWLTTKHGIHRVTGRSPLKESCARRGNQTWLGNPLGKPLKFENVMGKPIGKPLEILYTWPFTAGKNIELNGGFSSTPCLMRVNGPHCWVRVLWQTISNRSFQGNIHKTICGGTGWIHEHLFCITTS